jgi:hypothetical protein
LDPEIEKNVTRMIPNNQITLLQDGEVYTDMAYNNKKDSLINLVDTLLSLLGFGNHPKKNRFWCRGKTRFSI